MLMRQGREGQQSALPKTKAREVSSMLRLALLERGVSIRQFAKESGIGKATVERLFADEILTSLTLKKIKDWAGQQSTKEQQQ